MRKLRNIAIVVALGFVFAWIAGCGGCNPAPETASLSPTEGPETGETSIRITGDKFNMKKGVTVTVGGKNATGVNVPSKTEITAVTPPGTAGQSVSVVVTNNGKPDAPATLGQKFTYTDATPPTVTGTSPADGTNISDYEDSLNVMNSVSITFSESVNSGTGSVTVQVESTPGPVSQESGAVSGSVGGSGNTVTFTSDQPMGSGRKYTVSVSGVQDTTGNALASAHSFSFTITSLEKVSRYRVRKGDTLPIIAARPEVYDNAKLWPRLVEANQDDYYFDRDRIIEGQWLWVPRGEAWGDEPTASTGN
ncbi:MAG: Ig-like domain-containing protein [Candidatus Poribacteria bacterium]|nr:Ig-like domain-containing protein [Candidatus Poribacteria bacterium]